MTDEDIHAFNHVLIAGRIRELMESDAKGRRLAIMRDLLAFSLLGHERQWPVCRARLQTRAGRLF